MIMRVGGVFTLAFLGGLLRIVNAVDVLSTSGFQNCGNGTQDVTVSQFQLSYDRTTKELVFAVAGNSLVSQNVTGILYPTPTPLFSLMEIDKISSSQCDCSWRSEIFQFF